MKFFNCRSAGALAALLALTLLAGCQRGPKMVPVSGKVLYNGRPLSFGSIMFQPDSGRLARGTIQADGSFQLTTHSDGDGCAVGPSRVRVSCFESQRPQAEVRPAEGEVPLGGLLIPNRYTSFGTSGLTVEVRPGGEPIVIELSD